MVTITENAVLDTIRGVEERFIVANPRGHVIFLIRDRLVPWTDGARGRAVAALALLDDAIARLKGSGDRATHTRGVLKSRRETIARAAAVYDSIGEDFSGALAGELIARMTATRAALVAARAVRNLATRETVAEALIEIEKCLADIRQLDRDVIDVLSQLAVPSMPDAHDFARAEQATAALESASAKQLRAVDVHGAIGQALETPGSIADLFIIYETKPDHPLIKWRAQALAERG